MYQRVNFLYLAASLVSNVENDAMKILSHFYSNTMVLVKQKAQVKLHPEMKRTFCKKCHALLLPHLKNANMKICKMGRANLKIHCKVCGTCKRYPLNKNYCLAIEKQEQEAAVHSSVKTKLFVFVIFFKKIYWDLYELDH
ncbi:Ribonuclease P protein subunit rpr2 [Trichinella pseudospiralis]|uniref:Ribonuclease P protein subunit rpr2 n=1 Tax=Trichinella pseudospiralis TaxID=6337 RepID=A0A0V1JZK2_TRIPS|nr:Ribonuclease P protein subunit rpr2 [Trichinella pseudospiralis]KRZ40435.1 Ribonuclease P protein subunit rpr2 [Trichinella pseudospiralis]